MDRNKSLVLLVLILVVVSFARPAAGSEIDLDQLRIEHRKLVLDNGLTLLVHEDHSVPVVAVNLWYHVGSKNERRGRTGFAHLFEHFFFNGSENYPHGFREAMDDLGVNNRNGTTSTDRTNFFEDVPVAGLERTLYLEADRMGFLAGNLSEEMLERERGVVKNEKRQGENQPYGRVYTRIVESIYPYSHPYSWPTLGSLRDLNAASLEDINEWYRTYYGPNNCVLSLAGDITPERALELVSKYFGSIPPGPPLPRYDEWVPKLEHDIRDSMEDRAPQARIHRAYHLPGWRSPELMYLELTARVLSGNKGSPLDRRLVYEKELATGVSAFVWDKELTSTFVLMATVKLGVDAGVVEREMDAVVDAYLKRGPTQEELERARMTFVSGFLRGMERLGGFGGRSDILAESMTFGGSPEAYLGRIRRMVAATPQQVAGTSRKWLDANHYTLTVKPAAKLAAADEPIDRSVLPGLDEAPDVSFPMVQKRALPNGLEILLIERHGAPLVNMALAVDAGYAADPGEKAGTAALALNMMEEGTASRDAFAIADELDLLGASLSTGNTLDLSMVQLRALKMNLAASLGIYSDVVLNPAFPQAMVELGKRRQIARIRQEKAQPGAAARRLMPRILFGEGHAYSNPWTGSGYESSVEAITRDDLASWHGKWFKPNNATLIVTGEVTMEELLPAATAAFGGWKKGKAPGKDLDHSNVDASGRVYLIDKPDAPQSVIVAAHLSRPGGEPEDLAMETVMQLFGGMSTSRLNRNLRLDKHWSYGSRGALVDARGQRPFMVIAPVQTDKTKEAMVEVAGEIRGIAGARPIEGEEFESIKRNMVLGLPGRFGTLRSLERAALKMVSLGYAPDYYYDYAGNVRKLTAEDLNTAAAAFIRPGNLVWMVIGDLSRVEQGIRELEFGQIIRLDHDGQPIESGSSTGARASR